MTHTVALIGAGAMGGTIGARLLELLTRLALRLAASLQI